MKNVGSAITFPAFFMLAHKYLKDGYATVLNIKLKKSLERTPLSKCKNMKNVGSAITFPAFFMLAHKYLKDGYATVLNIKLKKRS